jgi:hypothetical protein
MRIVSVASYAFSQQTTTPSGTGYDVADSSIIPAKGMPQHTEFHERHVQLPGKAPATSGKQVSRPVISPSMVMLQRFRLMAWEHTSAKLSVIFSQPA